MGNIIVLPDNISNKIAAGEVVERPASVIKELIENAIDASAEKIEIDIKDGGQTYIRIADDGCGMSAEDAALSLQRHATSKIKSDEDLFSINTLGFRGEALPSIAAVSRMKLTTRTHNSDTGTFINIEGGQVKENRQTGAAPGTVIEINNIFFNTPARRKFLKSKITETGHITDIITKYCLAYPQIHFSFNHGRQQIYLLPSVKTVAERITAIWQSSFFKELVPIEKKSPLMNIRGFIAKPNMSRTTRASQYIFINKRPIRNNSISHALSQGFQGLLTKGRFPIAFLFLEIEPSQIDVNVHPAKSEVKFSRQTIIHDLIANLTKNTLETASLIPSALPPEEESQETGTADKADKSAYLDLQENKSGKEAIDTGRQERIKGAIGKFLDKHSSSNEPWQEYPVHDKTKHTPARDQQSGFVTDYKKDPLSSDKRTTDHAGPEQELLPEVKSTSASSPEYIEPLLTAQDQTRLPHISHIFGQLNNSYILCQTKEGLLLIDQHAAHERVLYEKLRSNAEKTSSQQQALLIPVTLELTKQEALYLQDNLAFWKEMGFDIEEFGSDTFIIRSVPPISKNFSIDSLVRDIIDQLQEEGIPAKGPKAKDKLITMMACKLAVKAGQRLKTDEITSLLNQMASITQPYTCPHGRPSMIKIDMSELDKKFHRT